MSEKRRFLLLVFLFLWTACAPVVESPPPEPKPEDPNATAPPSRAQPPFNTYAPAKGDESMSRGEVYFDTLEILVLQSFPPQFHLQVKGFLPTPCHELRAIVAEPNAENQIHVQIYSVFDPGVDCEQVLKLVEAVIPLGSYIRGTYKVFVNDREVGEIVP